VHLQLWLCTALHGMPAWTTDEKGFHPSLCLSVHPSAKCMDCDKMEERSVQICIRNERLFSIVF